MVHILLRPGLENFEHYFGGVWDECNCAAVWTFFGIAFFWDWNENWLFLVLWPLLCFPNLLAYWVQHFNSIIFYFAFLENIFMRLYWYSFYFLNFFLSQIMLLFIYFFFYCAQHSAKLLFFMYLFFYFTRLYWFCHTSTWIRQGCTHVPHPEQPPTALPIPSFWVIPVHQPQASCILHRTWTGDSFLIWYYACFNKCLVEFTSEDIWS